ncbi:hypothetical protein [Bdellovibrio sp.]|uniref:hypothetical protein n=1 Tax=Bdellovibrio sp. TaxID=28201 RepID=UPI003221D1FE
MNAIFKEEEKTFVPEDATISLDSINPDRIPEAYYGILSKTYKEITRRLNSEFESVRTFHEQMTCNIIKSYTKIQIYNQVWIGSRCFDIFIPSVRGLSPVKARGLAIEVDGPVHDTVAKMKKDTAKDKLAESLGIMVHSLPNHEVLDSVSSNFLLHIKDMPRLSYREYRRLWAKIHLKTIELKGNKQEKDKIISIIKELR